MHRALCLLALIGLGLVVACTNPDEIYPEREVNDEEIDMTRVYVSWQKAYAEGEVPGEPGQHLGYVKESKDRVEQTMYVFYLVYDREFKAPVGYYTEKGDTYRYPGDRERKPVYLGNYTPEAAVGRLLGYSGDVILGPMNWNTG